MKLSLEVLDANSAGVATCILRVTLSDGKLIHSHTMQVDAGDVRQGLVQAVVDYTGRKSADGRSSKSRLNR
jgi:hypothetical protein